MRAAFKTRAVLHVKRSKRQTGSRNCHVTGVRHDRFDWKPEVRFVLMASPMRIDEFRKETSGKYVCGADVIFWFVVVSLVKFLRISRKFFSRAPEVEVPCCCGVVDLKDDVVNNNKTLGILGRTKAADEPNKFSRRQT